MNKMMNLNGELEQMLCLMGPQQQLEYLELVMEVLMLEELLGVEV